jgi:hypothetical protein
MKTPVIRKIPVTVFCPYDSTNLLSLVCFVHSALRQNKSVITSSEKPAGVKRDLTFKTRGTLHNWLKAATNWIKTKRYGWFVAPEDDSHTVAVKQLRGLIEHRLQRSPVARVFDVLVHCLKELQQSAAFEGAFSRVFSVYGFIPPTMK